MAKFNVLNQLFTEFPPVEFRRPQLCHRLDGQQFLLDKNLECFGAMTAGKVSTLPF